MTRLTYGISGCCVIVVVAALFFLLPDTQRNERVYTLEREATSLPEQLQNPVPSAGPIPRAAQQPAHEASSNVPLIMNAAQLMQQVAELSEAVARLEQTARNLDDRISRTIRLLPTSEEAEAGLTRRKAELDAQAESSLAATAELQRFAARFGVALDERVLTDRTFSTHLDNQPGFTELRLTATAKLRVLQAVERRYAADLLDRVSIR